MLPIALERYFWESMKDRAIIFGTGNYYRTKKESVEELYDVVGFIDCAVGIEEEHTVDGKPSRHPSRVNEYDDANVVLCSAKLVEMWQMLIQHGVKPERIVFGSAFLPEYDEFERLLKQTCGELRCENSSIFLNINNRTIVINNESDFENAVREVLQDCKEEISLIQQLPCLPVSRRFGNEHGKPIDRFYIDRFIEENKNAIRGTAMEIAEDRYLRKYEDNIDKKLIMHVNGWGDGVIRANLASGEGITSNMADCLICTQTIQFIYDITSTVKNIHKLLKPGGCALVTAHGLAPISLYDYRNWGEYWRFTDKALFELFSAVFGDENIGICSYGNVKVASAFLYGLTVEDLNPADFEYNDDQMQMVITVKAVKGSGDE